MTRKGGDRYVAACQPCRLSANLRSSSDSVNSEQAPFMNAPDTGPFGFAGLSPLGIVYSLATSAQGFEIIAYDRCEGLVQDLREGRFPVREPGLDDLFAANRGRIRYTADSTALA